MVLLVLRSGADSAFNAEYRCNRQKDPCRSADALAKMSFQVWKPMDLPLMMDGGTNVDGDTLHCYSTTFPTPQNQMCKLKQFEVHDIATLRNAC